MVSVQVESRNAASVHENSSARSHAAAKFVDEAGHRSLKRDILSLRMLMPYIGHVPIEEVCDDSLAKFKADRLAGIVPPPKPGDPPRPVMAGTVNRDLSTVISVLNRATRLWMWIPHVPLIRRVEGPRKKPYPLSWKEQDRLFAKLPEHLRQASLFKVNTGLRERELCSLTWDMEVAIDELDTTAFILQETQTKNGQERLVVLNTEARRVIEAQRGKHETFVFTYQRGKESPVLPLLGLENNAWRKAWRKAKLPVDALTLRGVHNLRHTFGHRLRSAGVSLEDRKDLLGHKSNEVTTLYSLADISRLIEFVERITVRKQTFMLRPVRQSSEELADSRV